MSGNIVLEITQVNKGDKSTQIRKEEDTIQRHMILYLDNPKESTAMLPELRTEFIRVTGYKVNISKSNAFVYISRKQFLNSISQNSIKKIPARNQIPRNKLYKKLGKTASQKKTTKH